MPSLARTETAGSLAMETLRMRLCVVWLGLSKLDIIDASENCESPNGTGSETGLELANREAPLPG